MNYYRHLKSGQIYELVLVGKSEADPKEYIAIYREAVNQPPLPWVRPMSEFQAKFQQLSMHEYIEFVRNNLV